VHGVRRGGVPVRPGDRGAARVAARRSAGELVGLLTGGAAEPVASGRYGQGRLCERLLEQLARISHEREPLAIVLEDIHWADRSSRDLIEFLARNLRTERIAVLLTYRTGELDPCHALRRLVAELGRKPVVWRIELAPLGRADVARQLEAIAGGPVAAREVERIHARSGGNPFFVEELYATGEADIPATLAEVVAARVARLSPAAARVLTITAAAGGRVHHEVLAGVVGEEQLGAAVREGLDAGFLVRDDADRGVALRHALISEVVYRDLVPYERERLHGELGRALTAAGAPAAQLAHHWHVAGARDQALAESLRAAEEALSVYAFPEALVQLERALELGGGDRLELLASAGRAARYTGERERSVALVRQALAEFDHAGDPSRAAQLYGRLGEYQYWDDAAALDCYERALALLGTEPSQMRAELLAAKGHALLGLRRLEEARAASEAALATGGEEAVARTTLGLVLGFLGEHDAGEEQLRRALALPVTEHTPRAYVHVGELLRLRGDHAGAEAAMREGEAAAARLGMRATFGRFMFVNSAADLVRLGRWDDAQERLEAAERLELGLTTAALRQAVAGELYALRGETGRARSQLEPALKLAGQGIPSEFIAPIHGALATLATVEADPARRAARSPRRWRRSARSAIRSTRLRCMRSACAPRPTTARRRRAPTSCSTSSIACRRGRECSRMRRWRAPSAAGSPALPIPPPGARPLSIGTRSANRTRRRTRAFASPRRCSVPVTAGTRGSCCARRTWWPPRWARARCGRRPSRSPAAPGSPWSRPRRRQSATTSY